MVSRPLSASVASSLAAILILAAGCGEQTPTATRLEPSAVEASQVGIGHQVSAIQKVHQAGTFSKVITPAGGSIDFGIGSISFPAGAVSRATAISATVNGTELAVELEPHGTVFPVGKEPTLALDASHASSAADRARVYYVDDTGAVLETLATNFSSATMWASVSLQHFSKYALAAE